MGGYKESKIFDILKRKSIIIKYIVFIALIFIITTMFINQTIKKDETLDIVYTENSNIDYKVYLKENDFFEEKYWGQDNQYIASLIDYIQVNFKYDLAASKPDVDYKYTYKIAAETNVVDKATQKSLYKYSEDLVKEKVYEANTRSKLKINEPIKVDYNKYNNIINRFVDVYDLDGNNATVTINMYVNVVDNATNTDIESNVPVMSLTVPLTTKTMAIDIESNSVNGNEINVCTTINQKKFAFGAIVLLVLDIILVIKLFIFIKDTKDEKAVYNMRLRKIMSNYGSYVQKLNNEYNFDEYQILEMKSFEDLLQVREIINKPIFMIEKTLAKEAYFFIPCEKDVYVYELKTGNLRKNRGKRYKSKEDSQEKEEVLN